MLGQQNPQGSHHKDADSQAEFTWSSMGDIKDDKIAGESREKAGYRGRQT